MIEVARQKLAADRERLCRLLQQSANLLAPFEDPFQIDLGLHRWLSAEREEAYSDWLQWVIVQVRRPDLVFGLFGLQPPDDWKNWADVPPEVYREVPVAEGHDGHGGRLDIVVDYPGHARLIVEVKKTGADEADTDKGMGYRRSQAAGSDTGSRCQYVLLATTGAQAEYAGGFRFRSWADVCVGLRRIIQHARGEMRFLTAAMILAFVGAVEQNLLGFSQALVARILEGRLAIFNPNVVDHLQSSIAGGPSEP
jgi:hypothetical protein